MVSGLAARNGGRASLAILVAILLLGLGLRLDSAWQGRAPVYDAAAYAAIAANLEQGEGFTVGAAATQPSSNYSPGLPLLVAGAYEVSGGVHERSARLLLALIGSLAVLFTYLLGRRLSGPAAGLIGAAAIAVYPAFLEYQGMLMSEPLAATLLSGAVLAMFWAADRDGGVRWLGPGALLGALALVRPEYLAIAVLLSVAVGVRSRFVVPGLTKRDLGTGERVWRRYVGEATIVLAGVAIVVAPWTIRNAEALGRFVPISTGGGQVLFAGTYLPSDGDPEKVGAEVVAEHPELFSPGDAQRLRLEQILARLAAQRYPELESDQALSRMGKDQLWDDIGEEPVEYAGFVATKIGRIWSHGPRAVMREPLWETLHWVLVGFGLLGLAALAWRRRWEALVLATIFFSITALSALLVASPRRVLVMAPLIAALAGVGAIAAGSWLRDRRFRP